MNEILETAGRFRVRLETDPDPQNPRKSQDNLCHVITVPHSHYIDVDTNGGPLQNGWDRIEGRSDAVEVFTRWAQIFHGAVVAHHTPERGPNSIWYLMGEDAEGAGILPEAYLNAERTEYQAWADGEVYGYIIEQAVDWYRRDDDESMATWEDVADGSCWGLIGAAYAEQAAREAFAPYRGKPIVNTSPVAGRNDTAGQLTVEYSGGRPDPKTGMRPGGLISLLTQDDDTLFVTLYRHDRTVQINISGAAEEARTTKPRLIVTAGDVFDLAEAMRLDLPYPMRLADGTEIEVVAGNPSTGEIGREHADMDELRVSN